MSLRILISVTHLLGVGHLTRAAALARGLAAAGHRVCLVSGGRATPAVPTTGLDFVQLPSVHCLGIDFSTLYGPDGAVVGADYRAERARRLVSAFEDFAPDAVVTETYPFGRRQLAAEFRALIEAAAADPRRRAVLASVRDILNPPAKPDRITTADAVLAEFYDGVLVHGEVDAPPSQLSWPVAPSLRRRLHSTGYVSAPEDIAGEPPARGREIVVSGGGGTAGLRLFEVAAEAARRDPERRPWRVLVGHAVAQADFDRLAAAAGGPLTVERARTDFRALLRRAAVSVSQAGYNTVIDLAVTGVPAVLVPFEKGDEAEQAMRAEGLAERGRASLVREHDMTPETLLAALSEAGARPRDEAHAIDLGGIAGSASAIEAVVGAVRESERAWRDLEARLDALAETGRTVEVWWRDDDASEPSPALDRLLALAEAAGAPLALAVSPGLATEALASHLRGRSGLGVLAHGLRHDNRAPAGLPKRELGDRPLADLEAELATGLERHRRLFGEAALPVLVPPWNRIEPDLVPRLSALGFSGLSTFGGRGAPRRDGLAIANTHCDPILWRQGGGLAPEAALLDDLARDLSRDEPIGLLTHHLVHDGAIWRFVERLVRLLSRHPAVRLAAPQAIFAGARGSSAEDAARL